MQTKSQARRFAIFNFSLIAALVVITIAWHAVRVCMRTIKIKADNFTEVTVSSALGDNRIRGLDGLRGVAILLVVIYHYWAQQSGGAYFSNNIFLNFIYAGNTGVVLFFVLSGLLVSKAFFAAKSIDGKFLKNYAIQRSLRIIPLYYLVGLIGIFVTGRYDQVFDVLLFAARAVDVGEFSKVWWSLSTEIQFYVALPAVVFVCKLFPRYLIAILMAAFFSLYIATISKILGPGGMEGFEFRFLLILSIIGQAPAFIVGVILAFLWGKYKERLLGESWQGALLLILSVILLLLALSSSAKIGALKYMWERPWYVVPESIAWGGVIFSMLFFNSSLNAVLENRITRFYGKISFSLYLIHLPILAALNEYYSSDFQDFLLAFACSTVVAAVLYKIVEQPILKLKKKISNKGN